MRVVPAGVKDAAGGGGGGLDLRGHILVVPGGCSISQLGELCTDALVTSFGLVRVAIVQSSSVLPAAMASAWAAPGEPGSALTTAAELYQGAGAPNLSVLQIRSGVVEGRRRALAAELFEWARVAGVAEVVVLSSCSSHVKEDADFAVDTNLRFLRLGGGGGAPATELGPEVLPLGHGKEAEFGEGTGAAAAAAWRLLRGGGIARPVLLLAAEGGEEAGGGDGSKGPAVLCLLGLGGEVIDQRLMEQLTSAACTYLAAAGGGRPPPALQAPPSWRFEAAVSQRRLWG